MNTSFTSNAPPAYKRSIRNYLLDARFQLKWAGFLVLVALVVSAIMGVFLYRMSSDVARASQKVTEQGKELLRESGKNTDLVRMQIRREYGDAPDLADTFAKSASDLEKQLHDRHRALVVQEETVLAQQKTMLRSLVLGLSLLVILIGLLGIYVTHKVVGPIYKMKMLLRQVGEGKLNFHGRIRRGDELQDFFEVFSKMVENIKDRQRAEIADLEVAMDAARESGASDVAIAKIARVRDEMKASLDL